MIAHDTRDHAILSASSAHRWLQCPPSARLEQQFADTTSDAAREGTLAHELAEAKLQQYANPGTYSKRKLTYRINMLKRHELWQDEMLHYTDDYLDYIKSAANALPTTPYIAAEKRLDLTAYVPEGFGTADCILIGGSTLHVIDFKYGKGVSVSAESNPQMMLYALGAYEAYKIFYPITDVLLSIVQPRLGDASMWHLTRADLLVFGERVKNTAVIAFEGGGDFEPSEDACRFCRAKAQCRARSDRNIEMTFSMDKKPPLISNDEVGHYLHLGGDVARWLKDLQDYALTESLSGRLVPGWKAVEGRGSRAWTDVDAALEHLQKIGAAERCMLYKEEPLTAPAVEKLLGKQAFSTSTEGFVTVKPGKPTLVPETDKRDAITNTISASEAFKSEA